MSVLEDLLGKSLKEMTDEEVEEYISSLKRMRVVPEKAQKSTTPKSNKAKREDNLLSQLSPDELSELIALARAKKEAKNGTTT